jgi:hypothetical protein
VTGYEREFGKGGNVEGSVVVWFYHPRKVPPGYEHRFVKAHDVAKGLKDKELGEDSAGQERFESHLSLMTKNIKSEAGVNIRVGGGVDSVGLGKPETDEARFRAVNRWAKANGHYAAFPTFEQNTTDGVATYQVAVLSHAACAWDDVLRSDLGDPETLKGRFIAVNRWSRANENDDGRKFTGGFPTFEQSKKEDGKVVYGVHSIFKGAAESHSVPNDVFGSPEDDKDRFLLAHRYAREKGFGTGFPNFESSDKDGKRYYGVVCIKKEFVRIVQVPRN